jgi:hypothetical protein
MWGRGRLCCAENVSNRRIKLTFSPFNIDGLSTVWPGADPSLKRGCSFVVIGGSGRGELVPPRTWYLPLWDSFPGKAPFVCAGEGRGTRTMGCIDYRGCLCF